MQLPPTEPPLTSGPPYVLELQPEIPERLSLPLAVTPTGWLYQPFASAPRARETETPGAVPSYLIGPKLVAALTLPALSLQVPEKDADPLSGPP